MYADLETANVTSLEARRHLLHRFYDQASDFDQIAARARRRASNARHQRRMMRLFSSAYVMLMMLFAWREDPLLLIVNAGFFLAYTWLSFTWTASFRMWTKLYDEAKADADRCAAMGAAMAKPWGNA